MRRRQRSPAEEERPRQYKITSRIDPAKYNKYSYEQLAPAPFLPKGFLSDMPHLSELFRSKVSLYRSMRQEDIQLVILLIRMRNAFKKLLNVVIRRRCDKIPFQDCDPITLSVFERPVVIYDMKNRCRHMFEAKTLMVHIHQQLMHSDGGFPEPLAPRNPLTNIELTYGQLVSCYFQLRAAGQSMWTIGSLYSLNFNLARFAMYNERALRNNAIRNDETSSEQFLRFIQAYADHPISAPNLDILDYAITHRQADYYIICWRQLYINAVLNNSETVAHARGLVVLTRILSQNLLIYINEILPIYEQQLEEEELPQPQPQPQSYYDLIRTILGPGANANRG